jgi:hypothetical protein
MCGAKRRPISIFKTDIEFVFIFDIFFCFPANAVRRDDVHLAERERERVEQVRGIKAGFIKLQLEGHVIIDDKS